MSKLTAVLACTVLLALCACQVALAAPLEWPALADQFKYDRAAPLNMQLGKETAGLLGTEFAFTFTSANNEKVPGLLLLPPAGSGKAPYPCVLVLHGLGGSKKDARALSFLLQQGFMICALDAQYHGDRQKEGKNLFSPDLTTMRQGFIQTIIDYRRVIDYLSTRKDVNPKRLGLVGVSMGAIMGSVLSGVEPRLKATALVVGGGDWKTMFASSTNPAAVAMRQALTDPKALDALDSVDPVHYIGHISPRPLLMQNGSKDDVVPPACSKALWNAAKEPKAIDWYPAGHYLKEEGALMLVVQRLLEWMGKNL